MSEEPKKRGWKDVIKGNVLMMGLVSLFTDASSEMVYPLLPVFFTGLVSVQAAAIYVGLMEGIGESTSSILKIFSGHWSDKLGKRKNLTIIGYGISTITRPFIAIVTSGWSVIALRFADRVGKGIRTSPRDALISDSITSDIRGRAFSFHRAMDHLGSVSGSLLSILILFGFLGYGLWQGTTERATIEEMKALRWLFAISIIPGIIAVLTIIAKVKEIAPVKKESAATEVSSSKLVEKIQSRFYWYLAVVTIFTLGNSSDLFILFYGKTMFKMDLLQIILLWVVLHMSKIIFSFPGGYFADRFGRRNVIVIGWFVYALVYMGFGIVQSHLHFWFLMFAYGAYYGLTEGAERALVSDYVSSQHRGKAYGYFHGAVGIAQLPASLLFGVFWAQLGPKVAFSIGAALAGLASILLVILLSRKGYSR